MILTTTKGLIMATNAQLCATYSAALKRFLKSTGLAATELAELAGLEPLVLLDAVSGRRLPSTADRGRIADEINFIKRERGLA
jgi:transcriptional regulator with XRE-family HTH domain